MNWCWDARPPLVATLQNECIWFKFLKIISYTQEKSKKNWDNEVSISNVLLSPSMSDAACEFSKKYIAEIINFSYLVLVIYSNIHTSTHHYKITSISVTIILLAAYVYIGV